MYTIRGLGDRFELILKDHEPSCDPACWASLVSWRFTLTNISYTTRGNGCSIGSFLLYIATGLWSTRFVPKLTSSTIPKRRCSSIMTNLVDQYLLKRVRVKATGEVGKVMGVDNKPHRRLEGNWLAIILDDKPFVQHYTPDQLEILKDEKVEL